MDTSIGTNNKATDLLWDFDKKTNIKVRINPNIYCYSDCGTIFRYKIFRSSYIS